MTQQNFNSSIIVPVNCGQAFESITHRIAEWWATNYEGSAAAPGDIFVVRFGKTFGAFQVTEMDPGTRIVWTCIDCYLDLFQNPREWKDTLLVWEITGAGEGTNISFTHAGLTPDLSCYNDCERGWNYYLKESLYRLLAEGTGMPGTGIHSTISNGDRTYEGILFYKNDPLPELPDGCVIVDVKEVRGEHVISSHSIGKFDKQQFNAQQLRGEHFMIIENKSLFGTIQPLEDLLSTAK